MTLLPYSPLLAGAYVRPDRAIPDQYLGADTDARLDRVRSLAVELKLTANQLVLAWMMNTNPREIPVMAASSQEQLSENLAAVDVTLSDAQLAWLDTGS